MQKIKITLMIILTMLPISINGVFFTKRKFPSYDAQKLIKEQESAQNPIKYPILEIAEGIEELSLDPDQQPTLWTIKVTKTIKHGMLRLFPDKRIININSYVFQVPDIIPCQDSTHLFLEDFFKKLKKLITAAGKKQKTLLNQLIIDTFTTEIENNNNGTSPNFKNFFFTFCTINNASPEMLKATKNAFAFLTTEDIRAQDVLPESIANNLCEIIGNKSQCLDLRKNNFSITSLTNPKIQDSLHRILPQLSNLNEFNLNNSNLYLLSYKCPGALTKFCVTLAQCSSITHLDLADNALHAIARNNQENWKIFCNALAQCFKLTHLDLSNNALFAVARENPENWKIFCNALVRCTRLTHLNLTGNGLLAIARENQEIWKIFCNALAQCPELTHLDLSNNALFAVARENQENWKIFCNALVRCPELTHLDLSNNALFAVAQENQENWKQLGEALSCCQDLKFINLEKNSLNKKEIEFLRNHLTPKQQKKIEINF